MQEAFQPTQEQILLKKAEFDLVYQGFSKPQFSRLKEQKDDPKHETAKFFFAKMLEVDTDKDGFLSREEALDCTKAFIAR